MEVVKKLFMLLDPLTVDRLVNWPIDSALEGFSVDERMPLTHSSFNRIISQFLLALYDSAGNQQQDMLTEAIWILENTYRGEKAWGYDGALLDASNPEVGMDSVLNQFAQGIKIQKHDEYVSSVFARHIDPLDWDQRVEIAQWIIGTGGKLTPAQYAYDLPETIQSFIKAESELRSMTTETK